MYFSISSSFYKCSINVSITAQRLGVLLWGWVISWFIQTHKHLLLFHLVWLDAWIVSERVWVRRVWERECELDSVNELCMWENVSETVWERDCMWNIWIREWEKMSEKRNNVKTSVWVKEYKPESVWERRSKSKKC